MYNHLVIDLVSIFNDDAYLNVVLDNSLESLKLSDHEKKVYTKILYGVVEKKLLLDYYLKPYLTSKRVKPYFKNILRVGTYAIIFMNMANHFIVNELVKTVKKKDYKASTFVNWVFRSLISDLDKGLVDLNVNKLSNDERLSVLLSIPKDIICYLNKDYKGKLIDFFSNGKSINSYRINPLKDSSKVFSYLSDNNITYVQIEDMIVLDTSLLNTQLFKEGYIIAQDISSGAVCHKLNITNNMHILDVCSAPGSKSLQAGSLLNNTGQVIACDIYEIKLLKIKENALKLGLSNIYPVLADATSFDYSLIHKDLFDIVICDVPCSGIGVIGHKPDLKYRLNLSNIQTLVDLQRKILNHAKDYVKVKGQFIYSTCTITKEENEYQIDAFLKNNQNFKKVYEEVIYPSNQTDGFYICKLERIS